MTPLDQIIFEAFASQGRQEDVNKVYLAFLKTVLYVPVNKSIADQEFQFTPLFAQIDENYFILAFDAPERLAAWAGNQYKAIQQTEMTGAELVLNAPKQVYLCLNLGTQWYKEFPPEEVARLRTIAERIRAMKNP